jgi:hypothetical protein
MDTNGVLDSVPKEGPMNRLLSLMLVSVFMSVICIRSSSKPPSDDETLKNLEMEAARHAGFSDEDIAFQKGIFGLRVVGIGYLGHISEQSPDSLEKLLVRLRTANPAAKTNLEISDIKVVISGDTAMVTYRGISTSSGFKDPNANISGRHFVSLDTWQKQSGTWKVIAGAAVPTEPIPPEAYKKPLPPAKN